MIIWFTWLREGILCPKGISSQFIAGKSINDELQKSRIWWWLSLALYTKAGYVPWVLDNLDDSVAYIGIGYSINKFFIRII